MIESDVYEMYTMCYKKTYRIRQSEYDMFTTNIN